MRRSRSFRPELLGFARLESLVLLDGANWSVPALTGSVATDAAAVVDSKEQLAQDLATLRYQITTYKLDVLYWQNNRNDYNTRVTGFKLDVAQFSNNHRPKLISAKVAGVMNLATGKSEPQLVIEFDLSNIIDAVAHRNAEDALTTLQATKDSLNTEKRALDIRMNELREQGDELSAKVAELFQRVEAIKNAENMVTQEASDQEITGPTWDNSNIDEFVNDDFSVDTTALMIPDAVDEFGEVIYSLDDMP